MMYVGIDPGLSGGIAALTDNGLVVLAERMPETRRDVMDVFDDIRGRQPVEGPARAYLEKVHSSPQMGVKSAFTFGGGYERVAMGLTACEIPFDEITPQRWQLIVGCRTRGDKNVSKRRAQELFPHWKITHAIADALLIAECCRRVHGGK